MAKHKRDTRVLTPKTRNQSHPPVSHTSIRNHFSFSKFSYGIVGITAIAIIIRLWHITWGLPELYEEAMPLKISMQFWHFGKNGFDFNPYFFTYPAFTFYLNFLLEIFQYLIGLVAGIYSNLDSFQSSYISDLTSFVVIARLAMILFDIGSLLVTYRLACLYADRRIGLIAAFLIAINPLHVQRAHLINVDTPLTFFLILSLYFIYKLYNQPATKWYIWAGISIGLATATKYNGAIMICVLLAAHLLQKPTLRQSIRLGLAVIISILVFFIFNPFIVLKFDSFVADLNNVELHMSQGHLGLDQNESTFGFYFIRSLPANLGWPLFIITIASICFLFFRRNATTWILLAFPILYFVMINFLSMRDDRYIFPIFPELILLATIGFFMSWDRFVQYLKNHRDGRLLRSPTLRSIAAACCGLVIIFPLSTRTLEYQKTIGLQNTRKLVGSWIQHNMAPGSAIATGPFAITISWDQYPMLPIPFNAGKTENTIPFYDPVWYDKLDLVITSDYDYGRYAQEPERLRSILNFYDTIRTKWDLLYKIEPSDTATGPTFWLYRPPQSKEC